MNKYLVTVFDLLMAVFLVIGIFAGLFWLLACFAVFAYMFSESSSEDSIIQPILLAFFFFHLMVAFAGSALYALSR